MRNYEDSQKSMPLKLSEDEGRCYSEFQRRRIGFLIKLILQFTVQRQANRDGCKIAEMGAYPGVIGAKLAEYGFIIDGYDIVPDTMPERFKTKYRKTIGCDLEKITHMNDKYDLVLSFAVIEHLLYDPIAYLENCSRALKKQGLLLIQTPNKAFWVHRVKFLCGLTIDEPPLSAYLTKKREGFYGHLILYNYKELTEMLEYIGLTIKKVIFFDSYIGGSLWKRAIVRLFSFIPSLRNQLLIVAEKT